MYLIDFTFKAGWEDDQFGCIMYGVMNLCISLVNGDHHGMNQCGIRPGEFHYTPLCVEEAIVSDRVRSALQNAHLTVEHRAPGFRMIHLLVANESRRNIKGCIEK